ncbi:MAG TPA: hypothetical protein VFN78_12670 [Ktedonobacterales bacterium]|nr:hypothetical protein [Ktedonobacterales bacterium]
MPRRKTGEKLPARDAAAALRAAQAMNLRKLGMTYDAIAQQCGYTNRGTAYNAVQRELQRTLQEAADDLRMLEAQRLDDLYRAMIPKALKGDGWSVDRCLRIMERRAALLGLDAKNDASAIAAAQVVIREYPLGVSEAV